MNKPKDTYQEKWYCGGMGGCGNRWIKLSWEADYAFCPTCGNMTRMTAIKRPKDEKKS